ncbi:MAG: serine/threonine protein phosphatase [Thermodesulfobacteriota bacterium]|nr:MAG: serine/threonine protein phosphatase [Thermodesulfobacteriota bacterium]
MRIIAFGDIHMEYAGIEKITGLSKADLVIITGDFTNCGGKKDASTILDIIRRINPKIYAVPGNMDKASIGNYLDELGINIHGKGFVLGDLGIFGVGGSNPTPFNTPTEFSEEELGDIVNKAYQYVTQARIKVLISHTPPFNTTADLIGGGVHVGSTAIRKFIEEKQPDLCFTGHIHESRGEDRIEHTLILNPGMLKDPGWIEFNSQDDGSFTAQLN